jgi:hypothetical protein
VWSDHRLKTLPPREVWALAHRQAQPVQPVQVATFSP